MKEGVQGFRDSELVELLPKLKKLSIYITKDNNKAEDLLGDTVLKALSSKDKFYNTIGLFPWLSVVMRNLYLTQLRRYKYVGEAPDGSELLIKAISNPDSIIELKQTLKVLDMMPTDQKDVLLLLADGFSYEEVSSSLGIDLGTVKSKASRGRRTLEMYFQE